MESLNRTTKGYTIPYATGATGGKGQGSIDLCKRIKRQTSKRRRQLLKRFENAEF